MDASASAFAPIQDRGRMHGLDTLRAAAIAMVMLYHFNLRGLLPPVLGPVATVGWAGVDLFFVLSGFLIGSQLLRPYLAGERPSLGDFYRRRAYRILPAFAAVLLLYLTVPLWREAPGLHASWQYATFTWNLLLLGYPEQRAFSHVWSLCVEEHFYLLLPVLLSLVMRRPSRRRTVWVVLSLVAGGVGLRAWLLHGVVAAAEGEQGVMMMKRIYYPTYSRLDGLVMGVALAAIRASEAQWWSWIGRRSDAVAVCGFGTAVAGLALCGFDYPSADRAGSILFAFPALALGFGLLVASAASGRGVLRTRVAGASVLATLAFSLYLTHKSVAHATHVLLPTLTAEVGWRSLAVYVVTCFAAASLLYCGVERPFLALRERRAGKARAVGGEARLDPAI